MCWEMLATALPAPGAPIAVGLWWFPGDGPWCCVPRLLPSTHGQLQVVICQENCSHHLSSTVYFLPVAHSILMVFHFIIGVFGLSSLCYYFCYYFCFSHFSLLVSLLSPLLSFPSSLFYASRWWYSARSLSANVAVFVTSWQSRSAVGRAGSMCPSLWLDAWHRGNLHQQGAQGLLELFLFSFLLDM